MGRSTFKLSRMSLGVSEVTSDKYEKLGPIYADIGGELAEIVGGDPDGTFLYSEAGEGWVSAGVFKADGAAVRYFRPSSVLTDLLLEAWSTVDSDKRWAVMEYEITGSKFDAKFQFPEEIDPNEGELERRPRALKRRFGDTPVIYPPWLSGDELAR